jgi:large subunit ribosomal protein L4
MTVENINTYELLNADNLVLCEGSVSMLETLLLK